MAEVDLHAIVAGRLRRDQQRYTAGRRAIVDTLVAAGRPLTIPDVLAVRPELAQSSAYRNLAILESAGVVRRIVTSDEFARFELAEELTEHHHHLICLSCGAVEDFTLTPKLEQSLELALRRATWGTGFVADHHRLDLVGTCGDCG